METIAIATETFPKRDVELARRIHRSLLPRHLVTTRVDIDARYREMNLMGGDYAAVYERDADCIFLTICDVMGHGLAAAMLAGRVNSFVRHRLGEAEHPCEIVDELNDFLYRSFSRLGVFVTFFCLEIDFLRSEVRYAGCGHPPALLCSPEDDRCTRLTSRHTPLGLFPEFPEGCRIDRIPVAAGDRLVLYTDGVIETRNAAGEFFGIAATESIFTNAEGSVGSPQLVAATFSALDEFRHGTLADDALVVVARML